MANNNQPARREQVSQSATRHYHQAVDPHTSNPTGTVLSVGLVLLLGIMLLVGIIKAGAFVAQAAVYLTYAVVVLAPCVAIALIAYKFMHQKALDALKVQHAQLDVYAKAEQMDRERDEHAARIFLAKSFLAADANGNRAHIYDYENKRVIEVGSGNVVQPVPHTWSPSNHYNYKDTSVREESANVPTPLLLPGKSMMIDVMRHWDLRPDNLFLALGKGQQEIACTLEGLMHVAHDAPTDGGKTSQFYAELIQLLNLNVRVILCNPHFAPVGKKGEDWRPIAQAIEAQGAIECAPGVRVPGLVRKFENIAGMVRWLSEVEVDRRFTMQAQGDYSYAPLYIFIDEWPSVVKRYPEAGEHLVDVLQRGRAVEVCVDTNAQGFLQADVDLEGSARENFNTAYHMGGSVYSASKLLDMPVKEVNALLKSEQVTLGKGVALLRNNQASPKAQLVRLPYAENTYCYYMLGHADGWQLPEFRGARNTDGNVSRNFQMDEVNGNISDGARNAVKSDEEPAQSNISTFPGGTSGKRKNDVPAEISERIIHLRSKGFTRTEIRDAMSFSGSQFWMVKQVLDEYEGKEQA